MKIPTATQYLEERYGLIEDELSGVVYADMVSPKALVDFAKIHVKAALEAITENYDVIRSSISPAEEIKETYQLKNIK